MQSDAIVELDHRVARDGKLRPQPVIAGIGVRHERVETIVAALEFDQDEQIVVACARSGGGECEVDAAACTGDRQRRRLGEEVAARDARRRVM